MKKSINLSIPKPCAEKWENFTLTHHGGFCSSCNKTVVDFKGASAEEIFEFFKSKPAHACGRFRVDQLKTYSFSNPTINPGFALLKAGLLSLVFLLISKPSSAQIKPEPAKREVLNQQSTRVIDETKEGKTVKGVVLDDWDNSPLPGINIVLRGAAVGTSTDSDGRFEFPQKLKDDDVLIFSFIGFEPKEYRIRKDSTDPIEIKLVMDVMSFTGEVAVIDVYTEATGFRKLWTKVKAIF